MPRVRTSAPCALFLALAVFSACGLTGDEAPAGDEFEGVTDWCEPTYEWSAESREFEEEVLLLTNERRAEGADCNSQGTFPAVGPLEMQSQLRCAARMHSRAMQLENFFDHNSPNGDLPWDRMEKAGYSYFAAGENIARGQGSPEAVVAGWMGSDGHCANIMSGDFSEIGVGFYEGQHWTQVFGSPAG
jgi:uncharacterized protein YkwD